MKKYYYFGVDLGATFMKTALVNSRGKMVARDKVSSQYFFRKQIFARVLKESCQRILDQAGVKKAQVRGMGIGLPGPVDFDRGIVLNLTNIKGWNNFNLVHYLRQHFSFPVFIENDANCMALAEARLGAAKGRRYALGVTLGTGVGGGLLLNNVLYRGPFFFGGEVGHIPVIFNGPRCSCGGRGCLELYVGNRALLKKTMKIFRRSITLEEVSRLANRGDRRAKKIWQEAGRLIGFALSGVVNVFNPEVIVVGGGIAEAGNILLGSIESSVKEYAMNFLKKNILVKKAVLGNDAGVLGAALLGREDLEV